jgi:hypothetical protein
LEHKHKNQNEEGDPMSTNIAQLRANDTASYNKRIQEEAAKIRGTIGMPPAPQSSVPKPATNTPAPPTNIGVPTANPVPAPAMGYGGGNYNDLDYAGKLQMQNDAARIQNDPTFRQSEIDRTLGVIKERTGDNQDIGAQNDYLYRVLGYQPPQAPRPPQQVQSAFPAPPSNRAYEVGTDADREAEARRRVEQAIAEKRRIATQQKQGLATTYGRMRGEIGEERALENVQNQRLLNPFSGRSDYAQGMIARERAKTDRQQQEDFATRSANVDELLAGYENASEEERKRIVDELVRQDRDFGLSQGQLTGNYNGGRTLAGQQLDWSKDPSNPANIGQSLQNQLAQLKLNTYPQEVRQAAQLFEQQLMSGQISNETAQWKLKELQDPNSPTNQAAKLDLQLKQMEAEYLPQEQRLRLEQLQKQIAEIGKAPYKSEQEAEMDRIKLATAQEQLNQLKNGTKEQPSQTQVNNQFVGTVVSKVDQMTPEMRKKFFQDEKQNLINQLGLSGYTQLYNQYFSQ